MKQAFLFLVQMRIHAKSAQELGKAIYCLKDPEQHYLASSQVVNFLDIKEELIPKKIGEYFDSDKYKTTMLLTGSTGERLWYLDKVEDNGNKASVSITIVGYAAAYDVEKAEKEIRDRLTAFSVKHGVKLDNSHPDASTKERVQLEILEGEEISQKKLIDFACDRCASPPLNMRERQTVPLATNSMGKRNAFGVESFATVDDPHWDDNSYELFDPSVKMQGHNPVPKAFSWVSGSGNSTALALLLQNGSWCIGITGNYKTH